MDVIKSTLDKLLEHPDFAAVAQAYAAEAGHPEFGDYSISEPFYRTLEERGALVLFAVMDGKRLRGFLACAASALPHFADVCVLNVDAIYCDDQARRQGMGLRLLREARFEARERGLKGVIVGARVGTRAHKLYGLIGKPMNTLFLLEP